MNLLIPGLSRTSTKIPVLSMPGIKIFKFYDFQVFKDPCELWLWNNAPTSWVAVHGNREEWPPERCSDLFKDCKWSSICWDENCQRVIRMSYSRIHICCLFWIRHRGLHCERSTVWEEIMVLCDTFSWEESHHLDLLGARFGPTFVISHWYIPAC